MSAPASNPALAKLKVADRVGDSRVVRRPVRSAMATQSGKPLPTGLSRVYTDDAPGLKVGPSNVLVFSLAYMGIVVILHVLGKMRERLF